MRQPALEHLAERTLLHPCWVAQVAHLVSVRVRVRHLVSARVRVKQLVSVRVRVRHLVSARVRGIVAIVG